MENIIKVRSLCFSYNEDKFIDNLSFDIQKNSYTCIVGPNGSGKTTLSKLISGLLDIKDGEVYVDDILFNKENSGLIRKKIGVIFQNPDNQYVGTTLKDDIIFGLENHNVNPDEMDDIIDEVSKICGVEHLLGKEPYSMSGGQKQMGAIAGVLALNPKILILDEATSMLDPISKRKFKESILKLKKDKELTIISITHDMNETLNADNIILMDKGNIVFNGNKEIFYSLKLKEYNLDLPYIIELQKCLGYENYVFNEGEFFEMLEGEKHVD